MTAEQKQELETMVKDCESFALHGHFARIWWDTEDKEFHVEIDGCQSFHGNEWNLEILRFTPHTLRDFYASDKINWDSPDFDETPEYRELLNYHMNRRDSQLNAKGIVENIARLLKI